ncbi:glycosyltransferase family 4 protein [Nitrospira sp. Nam80]
MLVGFIVQGLPGAGYHGGALTCWSVIRALVKSGHRVCVVSLFDITEGNPYLASRGRQEEALRREGVEVVIIEYEMKRLIGSSDGSFVGKIGRWAGRLYDKSKGLAYMMPWVKLSERVRAAFAERTCDVFLCYHFDALSAVAPLGLGPLMAAVGDLWHLPGYFRWRDSPFTLGKYPVQGLKILLDSMVARQAMTTLLKSTHRSGAFAGHYAEWLKVHGSPEALYLRTPVPDAAGAQWETLRKKAHEERRNRKHRVLLMGDLETTSTSSGLRAVAVTILPRLVSEFGEDGFELRLVGGGTPPPDIAEQLQKSYVRLLGRVVPADPEFLSADVMIVPTNIPLGIRVRIITAWAFGCPVVAHRANASGIPEMRDDENALMADTDAQLGEAIVRILRDTALRRRLSLGGRGTYEKCFSESVAGQAIVDELERLGGPAAEQRP